MDADGEDGSSHIKEDGRMRGCASQWASNRPHLTQQRNTQNSVIVTNGAFSASEVAGALRPGISQSLPTYHLWTSIGLLLTDVTKDITELQAVCLG